MPGGGGGERQMRPGGDQPKSVICIFSFKLVLCAIAGVQSFHL